MRLIDSDALMDGVVNEYLNLERRFTVSKMIQLIKDAPTIDKVEVVRCKDCINYTPGKDEWGSCFENPMKLWRDNDYCSWFCQCD